MQTKSLTSKKTKNEDHEAELALRLRHVEEQVRSLVTNPKLESQLGSLSEQLVQLNQQMEAFDTIRGDRKSTSTERCATKQETDRLVESKNKLQGKLDSARSKYVASVTLLEEAKAFQTAVEAERIANDKIHAEQILPGQAERNALMEEKEKLAERMNMLHEESVSNDKENSKELANQSETLKKLDCDYKLVSEELTEKLASIESIKKTREQANQAAQKELKEHREFRAKFEEATAAETARLVELQSERKRERQKRCDEASEASSKMRSELERKLEILRMGAELIETTSELEKQ